MDSSQFLPLLGQILYEAIDDDDDIGVVASTDFDGINQLSIDSNQSSLRRGSIIGRRWSIHRNNIDWFF